MKSTIEYLEVDVAIEKLQKIKRENKKRKIIICTIDFDNNEEYRSVTTADEGCSLIAKANTIIFNDDEFIPHMALYSVSQLDLKDIRSVGIMHDILIPIT